MPSERKEGKKYKNVRLGALPVELINRYLGTEMEEAEAVLTKAAHQHMAEKHPDVYAICRDNLQLAIQRPDFIGQDRKHANSFIVIKRLRGSDRKPMLVAISLERNDYGLHTVRTAYCIDQSDVDARRAYGSLHQVIDWGRQSETAPPAETEGAVSKEEA